MAEFCTSKRNLASFGKAETNMARSAASPMSVVMTFTFFGSMASALVYCRGSRSRPHVSTMLFFEKCFTSARPIPEPPPVTTTQFNID